MAQTFEPAMRRTVSADGTQIAWVTSGVGPPLVLVHGMVSDHHRWSPLLPHLEPHVRVHAMDRRGRGLSGDAPGYGVVREFEDVAAVVGAVAEESGSAVDVYGHSSGGLFAFGATTLSSWIRKLVLYEGWPVPHPPASLYPSGFAETLESLLAEGGPEAVAETFFREVLAMPPEQFEAYRSQPSWRHRVAAAHTIPREIRTEQDLGWDPAMAAAIPCRFCWWSAARVPMRCAAIRRPWLQRCRTLASRWCRVRDTSATSWRLRAPRTSSSRSCTAISEDPQRRHPPRTSSG